MIRDYFLIVTRVIGSWFLFVFGIKSTNSKLYYASVYLFSKQSFRLPESAKTDVLLVFKGYYNAVKDIFRKKLEYKRIGEEPIIVLDSSLKDWESRNGYLNFFNVKPGLYVSREALNAGDGIYQKVVSFLLVTTLFLFFWPCTFSRNRTNYALLLRESVEWLNVFRLIKRNRISKLYMFSIYEKDSNFLALLLMRKGIEVSKITSEVPITFANKIIITNNLILCFNYQNEEVKAFASTLFYDNIINWIPERQINYFETYINKEIRIPFNTIGFYSGAWWLRKRLDHSLTDCIGSYDAEEIILDALINFIKVTDNLKLIIFLHPLEKRTKENTDIAMRYYGEKMKELEQSRIEIFDLTKESVYFFDKVNIGISMFSTTTFERLSLGFKCLLNPIDKPEFPLEGSPFRNICAYSTDELFNKIRKNLKLNKEDFFNNNDISDYCNSKVEINYILV